MFEEEYSDSYKSSEALIIKTLYMQTYFGSRRSGLTLKSIMFHIVDCTSVSGVGQTIYLLTCEEIRENPKSLTKLPSLYFYRYNKN